MALVAPVKDGEIQDINSVNSKDSEKKSGSSLDKNAFLQLLVAQMKYQDPLEPTSNTEYISQLATFSSLEEMQNMRSTMDLQRASSLVGQEVYIKTINEKTGATDYIHGIVDFVVYENNKAYLSIGDTLYSLDDLDSVYNQDYTEAYTKAYDFTVGLNKLPKVSRVTLKDDQEAIEELKEIFDEMTDYQKGFITKENQEKLQEYVDRIEELKKAQEENGNEGGEDDEGKVEGGNSDTDDTGKTEGTGDGEDGKGEDSGEDS